MTRQEILNTVVKHLANQNWLKSTFTAEKTFSCAYRGYNGMKCAAGVFIKDEDYVPEMEGKLLYNPLVAKALENAGIDLEGRIFLSNCQRAHDFAYSQDDMKVQFRELTKIYKLEMPAELA